MKKKLLREQEESPDADTISDIIADELNTEIDFVDDKIEFNYVHFLGGRDSPVITDVIKKAIEKVKTLSPSLDKYCTNIQADTYSVEGRMYGLRFVCDVKSIELEESTNNISGITDNDKLKSIADEYNTEWRIYALIMPLLNGLNLTKLNHA